VNLREQLERASGDEEAAGRESAPAAALRVLALLALAAFLTAIFRGAGSPVGAFAVNAILLAVMALAMRTFRPGVFASAPVLGLLAGLIVVVSGAAAAAARLAAGGAELVPLALAGVLVSALFDRGASFLFVLLLATSIAAQPGYRGPGSLPVLLVAGAASALVVRPSSRRDRSYVWMLVVAAAVAAAIAATGLAYGAPGDVTLAAVGRGAAVTVGSVVAAMLVTPLAERITGRETHLTLLEWGDLNRPLLQRLSLEAPGTYAHTVAIANLAEAAARAIGANALLARVGAYYHDIGKLARPQYFVENQPRGRNLHDKLKPSTSASIIRNHIREGLELAEAERVPASIRAFIAEHHGTATISFFLDKARDRDGAAATNVGEFTYPGPVPQSAETAIVMLADGAEAAARALHDPTPERIREVIELVVRQRLEQGQLRDAPLTLRQLTLVKEEFARVLGGMYHTRVEYRTPAPPVEAVPG
jgi:putative nucleotidyltransferase with HDIG domain